jgi:hypothetical protein
VHDSRTGLVSLPEGDACVVTLEALRLRQGKMDALRVVAASPTFRVVMRRNTRARVYLSPPRSK